MNAHQFIIKNWKTSIRNPKNKKDASLSFVKLPNSYTTPCANDEFKNFYYWDTYFTNVGLLEDGLIDQARNNLRIMKYFVSKFLFIPNADHLLFGSQPPFFTRGIFDLYSKTKDINDIKEFLYSAVTEMDFWKFDRMTPCGLNQYGCGWLNAKCIESFDYFSNRVGGLTEAEKKIDKAQLVKGFFAIAESGWDLNVRYRRKGLRFDSLSYANIDLNCILYDAEIKISEMARIIEDENEKKATIALVPFIPCSAKLPIISLVCATFFPTWGFALALLFYFMAIVIIFIAALIIKKIFKHKEHSTFISELPSYKIPSIKYIGRDVGDKTWSFIKRAGTVVVFFSVIVCVLASFTWNFQYVDGTRITIESSMLAGIGNGFAWFFYPMLGCKWNWAASVSAIQGLIAKEQGVASIRVIEAAGGSSLFASFTPLTAFAYATFNLFSIPCVATISTMRSELKSVKKIIFIMLMELLVAWLISSFIGIWGVML